ncbi:MAG: 30S ribosomal protein S14 [bacterium]|nr:30S ribosomal protein S14 [bacterium]
MARLAMRVKQARIVRKVTEAHVKAKDKKELGELIQKLPVLLRPTKIRNRCRRCGRARAYLRHYGVCRLCFRDLALQGEIPGVVKASW